MEKSDREDSSVGHVQTAALQLPVDVEVPDFLTCKLCSNQFGDPVRVRSDHARHQRGRQFPEPVCGGTIRISCTCMHACTSTCARVRTRSCAYTGLCVFVFVIT